MFYIFSVSLIEANEGNTMLIGGQATYKVIKGDTIDLIASKLGIRASKLIEDNKLENVKNLKPGTVLKYNNQRIVPKGVSNVIIINIPERMLYYFKDNKLLMVFPVGLGKIFSSSDSKWHTPTGEFIIKSKQKDPSWYVPVSIQKEMERQGKPVELIVSPGPDNPLGRFILRTSLQNIHIHETIYPLSVHRFSSHGCIRVLPQHMEEFYPEVELNTKGEIIYKPVKLLHYNNRVYVEIHKDYYNNLSSLENEVKRQTEQIGVSNKVDWKKIDRAIKERLGTAVDITKE
ncbi:MAG: L,D-transpeptidase family protein [Thermodesulfovibrionales bacterium]|nr:L,D-transpeptidase family protein [Thermodesulfovibrionales bacterium]